MPDSYASPILPLTRRQSIWLYVLLSVTFVGILHVASDTALIPLWARHSLAAVLATFSVVGVVMFGRKESASAFFSSTAMVSVWTLLVFAAVYFRNAICLYLALIPFLAQIVIDCIPRRGTASRVFIVIWALWFSTGIILSFLIHGPFEDIAFLAQEFSIAWYLDLRILLTLALCVFVLFHAVIAAQHTATRRIIPERELAIDPPDGTGMITEIIRGIISAVNDLLLKQVTQFINIVTGFISAMLCYLAATGREIGRFVQEHVLNFPLVRLMLRRIGLFALVLFLALGIPWLAHGTLNYVRTTTLFGDIGIPLIDGLIALSVIALVQLLLPIDIEDYIQRAARAGIFLVCVIFSAKTIAIGLSYIPDSPLRYARHLDALYILMVVGIIVASFAGVRPKQSSPNKAVEGTAEPPRS